MELFSAEMIFFPLSIPSDFTSLLRTPRSSPPRNEIFCFIQVVFFSSGPERVSFFQPVLVQRAAFLLHPSLFSVLSAAERFTADKPKRALQRIYFHIRPSVLAGVCLPVAAASRNAAVNFNTLSEEQ